jgi:putative FmdB family regulatory protein
VPTYQYSCTDCGHFFDIFQSFSDDSLTVCPECEGRLRKVFNAVGVVFKGSGFYRTDSRSQTSGGSAGDSGAPASNGSGKSADAGSKKSENSSSNGSSTGASTGAGSTSSAPTPA